MTLSRRKLLKASGFVAAVPVFGNAFSVLANAVVQSLTQEVSAQSTGILPGSAR